MNHVVKYLKNNIMNAIKFYDALCISNWYVSEKLYQINKQIIIRSSLRQYCRHVALLFLAAYIFLKFTYKKWIKIEFQVLSLISGDGFNRENSFTSGFFLAVCCPTSFHVMKKSILIEFLIIAYSCFKLIFFKNNFL